MNSLPPYVKSGRESPDRPRLSPLAQIVPTARGWLVRHRRGTVLLTSPAPRLLPGTFLQQLDGSRDVAALASANGLTLEAMSALIDSMARLELLDTAGETRGKLSGDWTNATPRGARVAIPPLSVLLVGAGALGLRVADELARLDGTRLVLFDPEHGLEALGAALQPLLTDVQAVICCADQPTALTRTLATLCHESRVPLVFGQLTETGGRVGPALIGDRTASSIGCPICAECHEADRDLFAAALPSFLATRWPRPAPWRYQHRTADIAVIARLVLLSLCTTLEMARGVRPAEAQATLVDFDSRTVRVESVAKHPACRVCFPTPEQGATEARSEAQHRWQSGLAQAQGSAAALRELLPRLRSLAGADYGLFEVAAPPPPHERHAVWQFFRERGVDPRRNLLANAHSFRTVRSETDGEKITRHVSEGFDFQDAEPAEAVALVEGLERFFALSLCPPRNIVQARYIDVATQALDPRSLPLYAKEQYAEPGFPLQRFDPEAGIAWVWGVDMTAAGKPLLVPADFVFGSRSAAPIFRANSNGAACHSSLPHAVINGIYETVERDALMLAWLNRLSLPRVVLGSSDPDPWSLRRTFGEVDLDLAHVDITTDLDIPVLMSVLRDRRNADFFLVNMVSSLDRHAQLSKLYRELAQFLFPYLIDRNHFVNERTADPDPDRVLTLPDHLAFYQSAANNEHAEFLTSAATSRRFGSDAFSTLEPRAELEQLVARLAAKGHRTIVVDCTLPLLRELGLFAVKVLIPGLQPLNCGHQLRPLGGERALTIAQRMGIAAGRRELADLNPWPHPFW